MKLIEKVLALIFPLQCIACKKEEANICLDCRKKLKVLEWQTCPNCKKRNNLAEFCDLKCENENFFSKLIVCCPYDPIIKDLLKLLKYKFSEDIVEVLTDLLYKQYLYFSKQILELKRAYIVPVPISRKRKKFRGFNQIELIIDDFISRTKNSGFDLKKFDILDWKYYLRQQAGLNRKERILNKVDSVKIKKNVNIKNLTNRTFVIIDDVVSTASTLNACAKALHQEGIKNIICFVISRN